MSELTADRLVDDSECQDELDGAPLLETLQYLGVAQDFIQGVAAASKDSGDAEGLAGVVADLEEELANLARAQSPPAGPGPSSSADPAAIALRRRELAAMARADKVFSVKFSSEAIMCSFY